jgi:hypothetical protein
MGTRTERTELPSKVELEWRWEEVSRWRHHPGKRPLLTFDASGGIATGQLAVYRFDLCDASGELVSPEDPEEEGSNAYVGETTNLFERLKTYRYGRGAHAIAIRRRLIRHFERHPAGSAPISLIQAPRALVDGKPASELTQGKQASEFALVGHSRLLFEQAAVIESGMSGRWLLNAPPELRAQLAQAGRAIKAQPAALLSLD